MMEILENRKDDGLSLQLRKAEKATTEVDHGLDLNIYMDHKTRSTNEQDLDAPHSVITEAAGRAAGAGAGGLGDDRAV
ncbi:hypothetical protein [Klebsiella pneumoniae]|uniref:hypothetical protein n=1 Tax=Klebsiella pneumoniae TaxID=573 RepID=UPI001D0D7554|nr:hypothetical protein [Klebsiella pneumoniae]